MKKRERIHRTRYDEELGFLASEYKYRFHVVQGLIIEKLEEQGYFIKKLKIKDHDGRTIKIGWKIKPAGSGRLRRGKKSEGCCVCVC